MFKCSRFQRGVLFVFFCVLGSGVRSDAPAQRECDDAACHCIINDLPCECRISDRFPPGTLTPRYPYDTVRFYYYRRPYQAAHLEQHLADRVLSDSVLAAKVQHRAIPSQPYAAPWLGKIYQQVEQQAVEQWIDDRLITSTAREDLIKKDRPLEYVDWQAYRKARLHWEATQGNLPAP